MQKGKINVQTENIFPIIKKFLYSDHEIFLRELISNAVDATQKMKTLASLGEFKGELGNLAVEVVLDKEAKTLTIRDKGIGMSAEEVDRFINQIAFSSAEEWVEKYKAQSESNPIIGHFGLGFYSSFMVARQVDIHTKSYKKNQKGVLWSCDGTPEYSLEEKPRSQRGTDVVLHIASDSEEFLEEHRILGLLKKYCKFLPVPIVFGTETETVTEKDEKGEDKEKTVEKPRIINNTGPAWTRKPADLKPEDYASFYRELYPMSFDDPLFHIHLNVDYPFTLTGILYFPKVKQHFEVQRDKIQLYCNQVFVTDSVEGIVPDFLTLLHGVLDSPDIPLNVSRSFLQSDSNVKKISGHITKKVADKLEELFQGDREDFEKKWDDIKIFIEYGMISDDKFRERAKKFVLLKNSESRYFTLEEYREHIKTLQTDKDKKLVHVYATHAEDQHGFIEAAREKGYDVLLMDTPIDPHFINMLESELESVSFVRVDAEVADKLIKKEEDVPSKLSEEQKEQLKPLLEKHLDQKQFQVAFENLSEGEQPMIITQPEFMRRMKDMSAVGGMNFMGNMPDSYLLVVNSNHPLVGRLLEQTDSGLQEKQARQLIDLAMLSKNLLRGEKLTQFVRRSLELI